MKANLPLKQKLEVTPGTLSAIVGCLHPGKPDLACAAGLNLTLHLATRLPTQALETRTPPNPPCTLNDLAKGTSFQTVTEATGYTMVCLLLSDYCIINVWALYKSMFFLRSVRIKHFVVNTIRFYKPRGCPILLWFISL
jgi:hypothetical protein